MFDPAGWRLGAFSYRSSARVPPPVLCGWYVSAYAPAAVLGFFDCFPGGVAPPSSRISAKVTAAIFASGLFSFFAQSRTSSQTSGCFLAEAIALAVFFPSLDASSHGRGLLGAVLGGTSFVALTLISFCWKLSGLAAAPPRDHETPRGRGLDRFDSSAASRSARVRANSVACRAGAGDLPVAVGPPPMPRRARATRGVAASAGQRSLRVAEGNADRSWTRVAITALMRLHFSRDFFDDFFHLRRYGVAPPVLHELGDRRRLACSDGN